MSSDSDKGKLSHIDQKGAARMVDVGAKADTQRSATASARITMEPATLEMITSGTAPKGDVLATARIAGIMAAKKTHELIPMCHPLMITSVTLDLEPDHNTSAINITATVKVVGKTGVEMEALTAASTAALTVYDMCKAVDRAMVIGEVMLLEKKGGKSGHFKRG